uniref:Uncharacterized protein n=1 Tax=Eutreptiella gymnastica TaxID=73025 RepID=A0A7S1NPL0_9EUGL|mmetsp:Transcript_66006/g.117303  ORF Transcript_66006/g.117303 Transcript_66006/m.117303 type:complete len:162 (+) Transcript_66006:235-720(+)
MAQLHQHPSPPASISGSIKFVALTELYRGVPGACHSPRNSIAPTSLGVYLYLVFSNPAELYGTITTKPMRNFLVFGLQMDSLLNEASGIWIRENWNTAQWPTNCLKCQFSGTLPRMSMSNLPSYLPKYLLVRAQLTARSRFQNSMDHTTSNLLTLFNQIII